MNGLISDEILDAFALAASVDELTEAYGRLVGPLADRTRFDAPPGTDSERGAGMLDQIRAACPAAGLARPERGGRR